MNTIPKINCCCHWFSKCTLCGDDIFYKNSVQHLIDCVEKHIDDKMEAKQYDIFLYTIGAKSDVYPQTDRNSVDNMKHARNIYYFLYLAAGGALKEITNSETMWIYNFENFIINCLNLEGLK
jgi:hypothetical protein